MDTALLASLRVGTEPAGLTLQPPLLEARFPRLPLPRPCPRTERGCGRLVPRLQREHEVSLAATQAGYQVPHGALQLWLPVGCGQSKQTSRKPCRTGVGWPLFRRTLGEAVGEEVLLL